MTNDYNIELLQERDDDKYSIRTGETTLPEELIIQAYEKLMERKSLDCEASNEHE